jgi:hypothetical protein
LSNKNVQKGLEKTLKVPAYQSIVTIELILALSEKKLSFQLLFCCYPASNRLQLEEAASASACCSNCRTPKLSADHNE